MHQGKPSFRFKKEDYSQQMQSPFLSTRMWLGTGASVSDEVTLSESRQPALLATAARPRQGEARCCHHQQALLMPATHNPLPSPPHGCLTRPMETKVPP